ncbi:MAG: M60 family metallopeptidase [Bacteroidaceae bacterium]|nr:M60 family metallopeptidase [Bacteroidaceae bacterium]
MIKMKTSKIVFLFLTWLVLMATTMTVSAQDFPTGLVRLKSERTGYYLSTAKAGSAATTARNLNTYNQVWVLLPSGNGYSLRSANTGEYLQSAYATPGSGKVTLYIRKSPNATTSKALYNISSDSGFGGSFLNTNDSHNLFSYSMDAGCDWYIEAVTNYTLEDVKQRLLDQSPYAGELSEGKYYRVISYYGRALQDAEVLGGDVTTQPIDAKEVAQYWTLKKDGDNWKFENVLTQRFLLRQSDQSKPYRTTTAANMEQFNLNVSFAITPQDDDWEYKWTIASPGESQGLHDSESQGHNAVRWSTAAAASVWQFQEVELSQEDIDAARGKLSDLDDIIAEFKELSSRKAALQKELDSLFVDKQCTTLRDTIATLTDEELAQNVHFAALTDAMKEMVLKVKNNTWQQYTNGDYTADYERFFRVADYHVYSNNVYMSGANGFTMSNLFGRLSGPTGIVADKGDIIYIYVSATPSGYAELMLEAVSTEGVAGANPTGTTTALKAGLNLFQFTEKKMLYVLYQLKETTTGSLYTRLNRYNDVTVHIEGGQLNGYWDATRGMTNADWKLLQKDLLKASPYVNLKTQRLVFQMDKDLVLAAEPNEMEGLMRVWDKIVENEDRYMGVEDFEGKYNNIWNAFSGASSYMHASTYGTWYSEGTISTIMNYQKMTNGGGNLWGPSHEIGHNHQGSINVIGTTESSNNLFSNINTFESGILNSRRYYPSQNFDYMASQTPWLQRNIWMTTSMFFQLYLYFHVQHHDDNFLPNLFRKMRKSPINKWSGPGNGGPTSYGKDDYLHLAKMICDVAQADLSEFFEAYGMFIPVEMLRVEDYSNYDVTTTKAHIDAAKAYMQKYEKKLGNIMFIDDRIIKKKADPDNIFGCVTASDGYKRANDEYPYLMASATATYVGGDYESFTDDATPCADDWYKLSASGKTITFQGNRNYAGHKFYDADGNLLWATNKKSVTLPEVVLNVGMANVKVVTANYDMTDTPCTDTKPEVAILDIRTGESAAGHEVIDLTGRRLQKPTQAGIYIIDGKKVFVR